MKTLITLENIEQFICCGQLLMDSGKILTAGARDELTRRGVQIVYGEPGQACPCQCGSPMGTGAGAQGTCCTALGTGAGPASPAGASCRYDTEMLIGVAAIIKQHYGITDPEVLRKVTLETAAAISSQNT